MKIRWAILAAAILLSGCSLNGRDFPSSQVKSIQTDVTTQKDVFGTFGEPVQKGIESGYETWTYTYQYYSLNEGWRSKSLYVVFNKDNTVRSYSYTAN